MAHSPPPWKWEKHPVEKGENQLVDANGVPVLEWYLCVCGGNMLEDNPEDAALIAAAPDLLEACKIALAGLDGNYLIPHHVRPFLKQAIAKAEGR